MLEKPPPMTDADRAYIPANVKALAERAEALMAGTPPGNPPQPQPTPPAPAPQPEPPAPQPTPPAPAPQPEPPAPQPTPPAPAPQMPLEASDAEVEAFLAQPAEPGSEMARMQQRIRSMAGRLSAADKRVAALQNQPPSAPAPSAPLVLLQPPQDVPDLSLPQEAVETYGADLINLMSQVADHATKRARVEMMKEIAPALSSVATTTMQSRQDAAKAYVDQQLAPYGRTFDSIDLDPNFFNNQNGGWLALTDPVSGATRGQLFNDAWQKADAGRLAAIMKLYLSEVAPTAASAPATAPVPPAAPPAPAPRQVVPLETLAAPGRGPTTPPPTTPPDDDGQGTITRNEIRIFYARKARGDFAGKEAEVLRTEQMIAKASAEGRVVG